LDHAPRAASAGLVRAAELGARGPYAAVDRARAVFLLYGRATPATQHNDRESRTDMSDEELSPEQRLDIEALMADLEAGRRLFVSAYNRTHPDWRDRSSKER
jgi:hypothetical protein